MKLTRNIVQKKIKQKTDLLFPNYKGSLQPGGNIFHTKTTATGKNIIFQTVLSYDIFPVSAVLLVSNNLISATYSKIFECTDKNVPEPQFLIKNVGRMAIRYDGDIKSWVEFLRDELADKEAIFEKYADLDALEQIINSIILSDDLELITDYTIINGLIAAKILGRVYYENIFNKFMEHAVKNEFPQRAISEVLHAYSVLNKMY